MSGGEWNYFDRRFNYDLEEFCNDIKERFPTLAEELLKKGKIICEIVHDIDYDVCSDTMIEDDADFEINSTKKLTGD
ncbi:hypothetical protein KAU51_03830 [Candidatus Parcubacteria bacterium]|nr:hypothetical protein [Candidatus Parcubacteria bacterium]